MTENTTNPPNGGELSAARRHRQARMRMVNIPMRRLLGLPFPTPISRRLMLLKYTGRKTGRAYRQPVSYVADGDTLLTPGGGNWKHNLRAGEPIRVRLAGRDRQARPEFIRDPAEVERLLLKMMTVNPRLNSFVPFVAPDGRIDQAGLSAAVAHGFCIVRWHLDPPTQAEQRIAS
jgi:deazaflavin-dependent oxidoreductase (nitroreductase family)